MLVEYTLRPYLEFQVKDDLKIITGEGWGGGDGGEFSSAKSASPQGLARSGCSSSEDWKTLGTPPNIIFLDPSIYVFCEFIIIMPF